MSAARTARGAALAFAACVSLACALHLLIAPLTRIEPPRVAVVGASSARVTVHHGLREVFLEGTPEAVGAEHARALGDRMSEGEAALWREYERRVPWWIARVGLLDWGRLRFRALDQGVPEPLRRELAGEALGFVPDPFSDRMATYQRLLFLYSLYDLSLPLERSPLIGCTTFALGKGMTADGHPLVGRNFDFEAGEWLDRDKVVFLVREAGTIPFASVGWPGFVGVVSGMNAEGVVAVVHGGRGGTTSARGTPVAFSLRQVLARAHDTPEALDLLASQDVLVSHIVFVADAAGRFAVVERAPGVPAFVRSSDQSMAVTNHFTGPLAGDPANLRVEQTSTTLARLARAQELLAGAGARSATPATVLSMLRDHRCAGDPDCPRGDRRAIDAGIATHGIVADTAARVLWVGTGPHLDGPFVRLDLRALLGAGDDSSPSASDETLP
ncbi:MAG: C45 family autoproteolytic acyltransferase/hydrolase [Polyangiaceae bacterium]